MVPMAITRRLFYRARQTVTMKCVMAGYRTCDTI